MKRLLCNSVTMPHIAFDPENYKDDDQRWSALSAVLRVLVQNGYDCEVWNDGYCDIITYDYIDPELCDAKLRWIPIELEDYVDDAVKAILTETEHISDFEVYKTAGFEIDD